MLSSIEKTIECELELSPFPLEEVSSPATFWARKVLAELMPFRRMSGACLTSSCVACSEPHLPKIVAAIEKNLPIPFVLPAFPGKSPNPEKVFGPLPDMAEERALHFLQALCDRIQTLYAPGAQIILCSDGRVFSDVVGLLDEHVTAYQDEIGKMILNLRSISTFNLEELYAGLSFDEMRANLMDQYGEPIELLRASVSRGKNPGAAADDEETHRLYCGITRFLFEDSLFPGQKQSRTALQKESRARAYEVIQRSKAWGELVEHRFPEAVRLSIHPQTCGAKKMGVRLLEPDNWQTPWHGVAVEVDGRFILMKRKQAEMLGAELVHSNGRPSHYVLATESAARGCDGI